MSEIPRLKEALHVITDPEQNSLVTEVLAEFEEKVLNCQDKFSKGTYEYYDTVLMVKSNTYKKSVQLERIPGALNIDISPYSFVWLLEFTEGSAKL